MTGELYDEAERFAQSARDFKTPSEVGNTIRLDEENSDDDKTVVNMPVYKRKIDDIEVFANKKPQAGEISHIVHGTEVALEDISTSLNATRRQLQNLEEKVHKEIPVLFVRHEILESSVGSRFANAGDFTSNVPSSDFMGLSFAVVKRCR
jgi:hypothetical protein